MRSATAFSAYSSGALPTTSRVGSLTTGVRGSSEGTSLSRSVAITKAWLATMVPSAAFGSTVTLKVIVATLAAASAGLSARTTPAVVSAGELTAMPLISGEPLGPSATATPLSVVLPAT